MTGMPDQAYKNMDLGSSCQQYAITGAVNPRYSSISWAMMRLPSFS